MSIKKNIFILFIFILFSINVYSYNSSYSNLTIDPNSWCAGQEITLKVYNSTDFENRKEIKADLCDADENPTDDNCQWFNNISDATVKIYNGPVESLGLLVDTKTSKVGEFTTTFPDVTDYYFEITPSGKYNELTGYFESLECKFSNTEPTTQTPEVEVKKLYNLSFSDSATSSFIKIENTEINKSSDIVVSEISDISLRNLPNLDYKIYKTLELKTISNINYTKLTIDTQVSQREPILKLFKYDTTSSSWKEDSSFNDYDNKIVIENANLGIYTITGNSKIVDETTVVETQETVSNGIDTTTNENNNLETTNTDTENLLATTSSETTSSSSNMLTYLFIIVLVIVSLLIGIAVVHHNKEKNKLETKTQTTEGTDLKSYTDIYDKATAYVKEYKDKFSKDQLYRALKEANVPTDVIDKIFAKEY